MSKMINKHIVINKIKGIVPAIPLLDNQNKRNLQIILVLINM